jgi:O-acetyl-ADP-ribose deacetylase (regulator of RNase III)
MSIKINTLTGNLLHVKEGHIVHGCNAQGVMGSGVALAVKETYPQAYKDYSKHYDEGTLTLGAAYPVEVDSNLIVWNAITQNLYGTNKRMVSYDAIQTCFQDINDFIFVSREIYTIPAKVHIPYIGAGLGGGSWNIIKSIIEDTMNYPVFVWSLDGKDPYGHKVDLTV